MITTGRLRLHIKTTLLLLLLLLSMPISSQDTLPKYETRAVWLTTLNKLDWPKTNATSQASIEKQKSELCQILDQLQKAGVNTVMLQTRVRATTIYPSAIEPWDFCLTGTTGNVILDGQANASNMMCVSKARLGDFVGSLSKADMKKIDEAIAKTVDLMGYYSDLTKRLNDKLEYISKIKEERNKAQDELEELRKTLELSQDKSLKEHIVKMKNVIDNKQ